jgi:O-antigen ligase
MRVLLYVLIFFQPFNHFNSFREISFYILLALFLIKLAKGELKNTWFKDITIITLCLLAGWSVLVSISGPFTSESLDAIRKNLLKEVVIFLVIISEFRNLRDIKPLLWVVVSSFAIVTFASIIESAVNDWNAFRTLTPSISWRSTSTYFFANYSDNSTFYLPLIAGWLVSIKEVSWRKWIGIATLILGAYLVYIYNARTQLIAVVFSIFIIFLLTKRFKIVAVFVVAGVLCLSLIFTAKNDGLSKYRSLFDPATYTTDEGLTNRLGLWQVVIEFIEERPLTGYGYGWKKLAWLVQENNSEEYWKTKLPSAYTYYVQDAQLMYGRVNPHNLALQITFEIGLIGLAIFTLMWITVLGKMLKVIKAKSKSEGRLFMLGSIGVMISYALVNITNGFWQENYGMMMFLFMASIFVINREKSLKDS